MSRIAKIHNSVCEHCDEGKTKAKLLKESLPARPVEQKIQTFFRSFQKATSSAMLTKDEAELNQFTALRTCSTHGTARNRTK